jgi:hypothetical protein
LLTSFLAWKADFTEVHVYGGSVTSPTNTDGDALINALDDDGDGILTNEDPNGNGDPTDDDTDSDTIPDYLNSAGPS